MKKFNQSLHFTRSTMGKSAKYGILILIRIVYGGDTSLWGSTRGLFVLLYDEIKIMKPH